MAQVVITIKIMPENVDVDLDSIKEKAIHAISEFGGEVGRESIEPVAFGLKAINLIFVMDENIGSTEELEKQIAEYDGVSSCEVTDARRAIG